jgi:hypothetical protein
MRKLNSSFIKINQEVFMAGQIKSLIDTYVTQMSKGNQVVAKSLYIRLALSGIVHSKYTNDTNDDPIILDRLYALAKKANIKL